jgi:hypothetical protein
MGSPFVAGSSTPAKTKLAMQMIAEMSVRGAEQSALDQIPPKSLQQIPFGSEGFIHFLPARRHHGKDTFDGFQVSSERSTCERSAGNPHRIAVPGLDRGHRVGRFGLADLKRQLNERLELGGVA